MKPARHGADGGRLAPSALLDAVDDWMLLVFGVPFALGVMALWDWKPPVAVAVVGATVAGILAGAIVLVRRREADSWRNALVAVLALLALTALGLALFTLFTDAVLDAVL